VRYSKVVVFTMALSQYEVGYVYKFLSMLYG